MPQQPRSPLRPFAADEKDRPMTGSFGDLSLLLFPPAPREAPQCTGTTARGAQCRHSARPWPEGLLMDDPQRCSHHMPRHEYAARQAWLAEQERLRREALDSRVPACWSWDPTVPLDRVYAEYAAGGQPGSADLFLRRFHSGESGALQFVLSAWHEERCAVCGWRAPRLVTDHDHDTGTIRGLLCHGCNASEPHDNGLFRRYRERSPAQILGLHLPYRGMFWSTTLTAAMRTTA